MLSIRSATSTALVVIFASCTPDTESRPDEWINAVPSDAKHIRFTTTEGTRMSVDVSPDGERLVFDLLGDLYTLPRSGGNATRVTSGLAIDAEPRFSSDGRAVAFISDRSGRDEIWLLDIESKRVRRASDNPKVRYLSSPTWSSDGRSIVVGVRELDEFGNSPLRRFDVSDSARLDTGTTLTAVT